MDPTTLQIQRSVTRGWKRREGALTFGQMSLRRVRRSDMMRAVRAVEGGPEVMSCHAETIRAFWDACERRDYRAAQQLVGEGYVWIDHTTDVVAKTEDQLAIALQEDLAWSDQRFSMDQAVDLADGRLLVQATVTQNLTGEWRSIKGTGQHVRRMVCDIFSFDSDGRITVEELYEDALSIIRQLGALSESEAEE